MSGVTLTAAIQPHEIPRPMRDHLDDIVRRVVVASTVHGQGHDLMLRVTTQNGCLSGGKHFGGHRIYVSPESLSRAGGFQDGEAG